MAFDDAGNLVVPKDAFSCTEKRRYRKEVECPKCQFSFHVPQSQYWATCRECHEVFAL